jgi:predicted O-methyltransferase YrrM
MPGQDEEDCSTSDYHSTMSRPALPSLPHTDPTGLYRYRDGMYAVDLLTAAIVELDLFTQLAAQPAVATAICRALDIHPRPTDVMLTLFVAMGLLERVDGEYRVTNVARDHLVSPSPFFLGPYYASFKERPICKDFVAILRTGRPCNWASNASQQDWLRAMEEPGFARQFSAAMDCRGLYLGRALARAVDLGQRRRLLDVAGGSGVYACCLVDHHPGLRAAVLERPPVDAIARRAIRERGFEDRVSVHAGDMLADPLPAGFDVHLFSNVIHDWDVPTVRRLLAASAASLARGGLIVIHDAHLDEDMTGPLPVAAYSTLLMHSTEGRCYSVSELRGLLQDSGFEDVKFVETAGDRSAVTASRS